MARVSVAYTKEAEEMGGEAFTNDKGEKRINNGLSLHIVKNTRISEDYRSPTTTSTPVYNSRRKICFRVYRSSQEYPKYSTVDCEFIGVLDWDMTEKEYAVPLNERIYEAQLRYNGSLFLYITSKVTGVTRKVELTQELKDD